LLGIYSRRVNQHTVWQNFLADPVIDTIVICTENSSHFRFIEDALLAITDFINRSTTITSKDIYEVSK
jgi:hypothetical protein